MTSECEKTILCNFCISLFIGAQQTSRPNSAFPFQVNVREVGVPRPG